MQHFHRLLLVAFIIAVLYFIKQRFDARRKEGFLGQTERDIIIWLSIAAGAFFCLYIYAFYFAE